MEIILYSIGATEVVITKSNVFGLYSGHKQELVFKITF